MNLKQLKFMQMFAELIKNAKISSAESMQTYFTPVLNFDLSLAQDLWEYLIITNDATIAKNKIIGEVIGENIFAMFFSKSPAKTIKIIYDVAAVKKVVYQYNPKACTGENMNILTDALMSLKLDEGEDILKCLMKNSYIEFGASLKTLLERIFIETLKRNPTKKIEINKKLSTLLLSYIAKIKTDERALLEQRIRETQS